MSSNYPPGVSGFEYHIGGPDSEVETDAFSCPNDHTPVLVQTYHWERWGWCFVENCQYYVNNKDMANNWFEIPSVEPPEIDYEGKEDE